MRNTLKRIAVAVGIAGAVGLANGFAGGPPWLSVLLGAIWGVVFIAFINPRMK